MDSVGIFVDQRFEQWIQADPWWAGLGSEQAGDVARADVDLDRR
jgi:hypothetical protein